MNRQRPVSAAVTAAIVSSLLLGCAQTPPKPLPTSDSTASTPDASSEDFATTTPAPWNSSLYGPSPEDLKREAEPAIYAAKADAITVMHEIAAQLPADAVTDITAPPTGVLMRCNPQEMQWYGDGEITLKDPADPGRTVVTIGEHWKTKPGYEVVYYRSSYDGRPEVEIKGPKQAGYIADVEPQRTKVSISAYSACFKVPTDFLTGGSY